ncbi:MAG: (E)-4-hydroxy-3-methylbut-2-enyl-diphosphate synthase [Rikenellaceae bacterium]
MRRYRSDRVCFADVCMGGGEQVVVQSMTNTLTSDVEASVEQILRLERAGCEVVRLTVPTMRDAEAMRVIADRVRECGSKVALVADIHFTAEVAMVAAEVVDKVRINPGNFSLKDGNLQRLIAICKGRGVAIRVGVNHGSLAKHIFAECGDTPQGMVESAIEFLSICREESFDDVVVSMKSSNTRVMVYAYRLLVERMVELDMHYPLHLGVTEAGGGIEGRVKSAVGIAALLVDGIGDTIRVSLTEDPVNEVPVAHKIIEYVKPSLGCDYILPTSYSRRCHSVQTPIIHSEIDDRFVVIEYNTIDQVRDAIGRLDSPIVIKSSYSSSDPTEVAIMAASDLGVLFLDGLVDGVWIEAPNITAEQVEQIELMILQASRVRQSQTEYIACPSCGRTLFDIESALAEIKSKTSHLKHLKIGVMGCVVNGPGEMADADYGYVGAGRGRISIYKGQQVIERNIPQEEALERLIEVIKLNGDWI